MGRVMTILAVVGVLAALFFTYRYGPIAGIGRIDLKVTDAAIADSHIVKLAAR